MNKTIISEGKTTTEAVENGLKELKATKDMVTIKVIESDEKRSFFSILTPRTVKVELTLKDNAVLKHEKHDYIRKEYEHKENIVKKIALSKEEEDVITKQLESFLTQFFEKLNRNNIKYEIKITDEYILVNINGENLNNLIGYRGETLNAFQVILTAIANRYSKQRIKVVADIENYRGKREKSLEDLAEKISKTVIKTRKSITLEPMSSYERKIIHTKLQNNKNVKTYSVGVEPYRKVVIALK